MADVFISYAREDRGHIDALAAQLEQAGLTCWWDKQLSAGERFLARTESELNAAAAILVVWSRHSVQSAWVADEAGVGRESGRIVPIAIDGSLPPLGFRQFQILDFAPWLAGDAAPVRDLVTTISRMIPDRQFDPAAIEAKAPAPAWWRPLNRAPVMAAAAAVSFALLAGIFAISQPGGRAVALEPSIAVLPFANLSGDPDKDYLARGVAVEIIDKLSELEGVEVISRNSSFTFGADADPREVGSDLKVAYVLTGSMREDGGKFRMTAELVDASRGTAIWSQPYESDFTTAGINARQRQIAAKVSGAMSIAFNVDKQARPSGTGTESLEAYDFYLRGLDAWWYTSDRTLAAELFANAIELDPDYAEAWAGQAIALASRWGGLSPADAKVQFDEAYQVAGRAVELDPDLSVAQSVFGAISTARKDWIGAEEATLRALKIARSDMALNHREMLLLRVGRVNEADTVLRELDQADPLRGPFDLGRTQILSATGRHDALKALLSKTDDPLSRIPIVMLRINAGDPREEVRQSLQNALAVYEGAPAQLIREVLAVVDDPDKARAVLRAWYADPKFQHSLKWDLIPVLAAWYGDTDLVLRIWREELILATPRTAYIWGPAFSETRARPEFKVLMTDIGLVDYWRTYRWADKCRPVGDDDFECF